MWGLSAGAPRWYRSTPGGKQHRRSPGVCRGAWARRTEGLYSLPGLPDNSASSCDLVFPFKNKNDVLHEWLTFRRERALNVEDLTLEGQPLPNFDWSPGNASY